METSKGVQLLAFGGSSVNAVGAVTLNCATSDTIRTITAYVVDKQVQLILGLQDCVAMGLILVSNEVHEINPQREEITEVLTDFKEVFDDQLGTLQVEYKIKLDPAINPVVHPPRKMPVAMTDRVKA